MLRRLGDAFVIALTIAFILFALPMRKGITYDARTRQSTMPVCETCKLVDPDHCWSCWASYYGNGCYSCPASSDGKFTAKVYAKR